MAGLWWSHTAPALFLAYRHCVRRQPRRNVVGQNRRRRYWRLHRPCYPKGQGQALINQEVLKAQGYCAAANIARRRGCDEAGVAGTAAAGISGQGAGGKAAKHEPTSDGWRCVLCFSRYGDRGRSLRKERRRQAGSCPCDGPSSCVCPRGARRWRGNGKARLGRPGCARLVGE